MDRSYDVLQAVYGIFNIDKILLRNSTAFFKKKYFYTVQCLFTLQNLTLYRILNLQFNLDAVELL